MDPRNLDLVGAAEVAERLGWHRRDGEPDSRRVSVALLRKHLPEPLARLRSGPVWQWSDVAAAALTRGWLPLWRFFGFEDEKAMWDATERAASDGEATWYITRLPDGRWAAWSSERIAADRITYHSSRDEALRRCASAERTQ